MAKSLSEYYATNYTNCEVDDSFLGSRQGLAYTNHFIQVFAVPIQLLTFYFICFKTPTAMKCMKWPLAITHFCCSALDFSFGTMATPYIFYPHAALFECGVLGFFKVPVQFLLPPGLLIVINMAVSLIYLFESRSSAILNNRFRIRKNNAKVLYYSVNYLLFSPVSLILINTPEDQEAAKLESLKYAPCPTREFFTEQTYIVFSDIFWAKFTALFLITAYVVIIFVQILFFVSCSIYYLYIEPSCATSPQTRRYQINFFFGIIAQTFVPLLVIVFTHTVSITAILLGRLTQSIVNFAFITVGIHGLIESLVILLIHGPYRQAVLEVFITRATKKKHIKHLENRMVHPETSRSI